MWAASRGRFAVLVCRKPGRTSNSWSEVNTTSAKRARPLRRVENDATRLVWRSFRMSLSIVVGVVVVKSKERAGAVAHSLWHWNSLLRGLTRQQHTTTRTRTSERQR